MMTKHRKSGYSIGRGMGVIPRLVALYALASGRAAASIVQGSASKSPSDLTAFIESVLAATTATGEPALLATVDAIVSHDHCAASSLGETYATVLAALQSGTHPLMVGKGADDAASDSPQEEASTWVAAVEALQKALHRERSRRRRAEARIALLEKRLRRKPSRRRPQAAALPSKRYD